jgi:hypothetical protein
MIPVLERSKIICALDGAATGTGVCFVSYFMYSSVICWTLQEECENMIASDCRSHGNMDVYNGIKLEVTNCLEHSPY